MRPAVIRSVRRTKFLRLFEICLGASGQSRAIARLTRRTSVLYLFQVAVETLGEALSLWLARHRAVRARQARRHEVDQGVRLSRRARHGDAGMDTREKLPALAPGNAAAMPDVRLARRATDLHRAARSADGSWRKVGAEVKASLLGGLAPSASSLVR
jgi:hypothetical protein